MKRPSVPPSPSSQPPQSPLTPLDPMVADWLRQLPEHLQDLWQERAAIREFGGGQARELAEALALLDVLRPLRR